MTNIKDLPKHKRPREKLLEFGPKNLKDKELLAVILRTGADGKNAIELSESILKKNYLKKFFNLKPEDLFKIKGIDESKACAIIASFELAKRALGEEENGLPLISSGRDAVSQLTDIRSSKKENFVVLYLNARNQLIGKEIISVGTVNASLVHPREVFAPALKYLSTQVILAHNHPSGVAEPTADDVETTRRLMKAGEILGIEVLDHLVVTENDYSSLKEKKLL